MSYQITITGHKEFDSQEESREFEEGVLASARTFVASLEGVEKATFAGSQFATDLLPPEVAPES